MGDVASVINIILVKAAVQINALTYMRGEGVRELRWESRKTVGKKDCSIQHVLHKSKENSG